MGSRIIADEVSESRAPRPLTSPGWIAVAFMCVGLAVGMAVYYLEDLAHCTRSMLYEGALVFVSLGPSLAAVLIVAKWKLVDSRIRLITCVFGIASAIVLFSAVALTFSTAKKCGFLPG